MNNPLKEIPVGDEQEYEPQVGDSVLVKDPTPNEIWNHSFLGTINDIIERDGETTYIIEDMDSDFFEMERDRFEVEE